MSLREKIGQLFMVGFDGTAPNAHIRKMIQEYHVGGVIYFRRNVERAEQVCALSVELQELAGELPLFIAIDQEGGMVARIEDGIALMPGNMAIGAAGDPINAHDAAALSGKELRLLGINLNLAPCADVNNNPANPVIGVRSFGEDPVFVGEMAAAAVRGYQESGVIATAKHFPGHGDTDADSHHALPLVGHDKERLHRVELEPFRQAIAAGVDAVLTAHVRFPAYEPDRIPATMSERILTGLLRDELGFDGLIITDCLEMKAISAEHGFAQGTVRAVQAGADIVLISHVMEHQIEGIEAVVTAVEQGVIPEERIDRSVERIQKVKRERGIDGKPLVRPGEVRALIGTGKAWDVARRVSEQAVTVVRNDAGLLPLSPQQRTLVVWTEVRAGSEVDEVIRQEMTLGKALSRHLANVQEIMIGVQPTETEIREVLRLSEGFERVVFASYNAAESVGQTRLVREWLGRGKPIIAAAVRTPYDLLAYPELPTYVACYENKPVMMQALAAVLAGVSRPQGKLPVTVGPYARGHGL